MECSSTMCASDDIIYNIIIQYIIYIIEYVKHDYLAAAVWAWLGVSEVAKDETEQTCCNQSAGICQRVCNCHKKYFACVLQLAFFKGIVFFLIQLSQSTNILPKSCCKYCPSWCISLLPAIQRGIEDTVKGGRQKVAGAGLMEEWLEELKVGKEED